MSLREAVNLTNAKPRLGRYFRGSKRFSMVQDFWPDSDIQFRFVLQNDTFSLESLDGGEFLLSVSERDDAGQTFYSGFFQANLDYCVKFMREFYTARRENRHFDLDRRAEELEKLYQIEAGITY